MNKNVKITMEEIGPEEAAKLLELNHSNRKIDWNYVKENAEEIAAGKWRLNGSTISMSPTRLLDGQHRLLAIKVAKIKVWMIVVRGLDEDCFTTIDAGIRKKPAGVLEGLGIKNSNVVCSALRVLLAVEKGSITAASCKSKIKTTTVVGKLEDYPTIHVSAAFAKSSPILRKLLAPGWLCALHYLLTKQNLKRATTFFSLMETGENLGEGDPIFALRRTLIANRLRKNRFMHHHVGALVIKAWNAWNAGIQIGNLIWKGAEEFPEIE